MKPWPLVLGMIVLLALVCSPGLAITKSDIFPHYQRGFPLSPIPTPSAQIPWVSPTKTPSSDETGSLSVTSTPTGARVSLDGCYKGTTPLTISGISDGIHRLGVSKSGYYSRFTPVVIQKGKTQNIHVTLTFRPVRVWFSGSSWNYFEMNDSVYFEERTSVDKPNIYLYSDHDLTARVRLMPEHAITVSDPVYQPGMGWQAAIWNGSLNGKGDFLFYEGLVPDSGWQKTDGYVIRAAEREQDMAFMLGQYGFNKKETAEFIDYWVSHLTRDLDYVFYPQETGAVEQVMPLIISPKPDDVMRIWFYAEPLVSVPEPVTSPEQIVREGFYVVEWGVMVKGR